MKYKAIFVAVCFVVSGGSSFAQSMMGILLCGQSSGPAPGRYETIELGGHQTQTFDGRGGLDTYVLDSASHSVLGRGKLKSLERVDILNEQFNTVLLLGDFVHAAQQGEVDVFSDIFDTVILDPTLSWRMTTHPTGAFDEYSSTYEGDPIKVLVAPGSFVISEPPELVAETAVGAEGPLVWPNEKSTEAGRVTRELTTAEVTWTSAGAIKPFVRLRNPDVEKVIINVRNGKPNLVQINQTSMGSPHVGDVTLRTDPFDVLLIDDPECWTVEEDETAGIARLTNKHESINAANVIVSRDLYRSAARSDWRVGSALVPGVWLLAGDTRVVLDTIDLRNGGEDILIIRNDGRLRARHGAIFGDPGDEIWLEGTAGWSIQQGQNGTRAQVPSGFDDISPYNTIQFSPGLSVRVLPEPGFLFDPSLLDVAYYPGGRDQAFEGANLFVSRGGFVSLSATQMTNVENLSMRNGVRNTLQLSRERLATLTGKLTVSGDTALDSVRIEGFPEPMRNESGDPVWLLDLENGELAVTIEGLNVTQD